jgi:negative regulator of sigma E activity
MTPSDQDPMSPRRAPAGAHSADAAVDKLLDHHRLQLSALIDGELPPDQARFLLRRLEHDAELRGCWERWQFSGDVMRGQAGTRLREGFAARVADAVAAQPRAPREEDTRGLRWLRWGGSAALAASVAVIAVFLTRQAPVLQAPSTAAPTQVVANAAPAQTPPAQPQPSRLATAPATMPAKAPSAPDQFAGVATALAVADAPRRLAPRRSRGQSQRAALRTPARATIETPTAVAIATPGFGNAAAAADPFSGQHVRLLNRPWPRALLPTSVASGAFTVDYGLRGAAVDAPAANALSPFAPRRLQAVPATDESPAAQATPD